MPDADEVRAASAAMNEWMRTSAARGRITLEWADDADAETGDDPSGRPTGNADQGPRGTLPRQRTMNELIRAGMHHVLYPSPYDFDDYANFRR